MSSHHTNKCLATLGLALLTQLVTTLAQNTCTHYIATQDEHYITSPGYPNNYKSDIVKCWQIKASNPSDRVKLETVDFYLEEDQYCIQDFLEIRHGSRDGRLVGRYCSSSGPSVLSSGRVLYLRFATSQTITERGFKLRYYSIAGNQDGPDPDSSPDNPVSNDSTDWIDWSSSPNLHLLIISIVVGTMFLVCLVTTIVAIRHQKQQPKHKGRRSYKSRMRPGGVASSEASSQQELATHIDIEHVTHNESRSLSGSMDSLQPTAPPMDVPVHYGNANPSSTLELPPPYSAAVSGGYQGPYLAYGDVA